MKGFLMRTMKPLLFIFLITILFLNGTSKSPGSLLTQRLDNYLTSLEKIDQFSGVVLVKVGNFEFKRAYGKSDYEKGIRNKVDTRFWFESASKKITATAILQLYDIGKINSLDDPITRYLPNFEYKDKVGGWSNAEKGGVKVSILHLLKHRSGFPEYGFPEAVGLKNIESYINKCKNQQLKFVPGSDYEYSNTGYVILGYIVGKISGLGFDGYLKKHIFDIAKMNTAGCASVNMREKGYAKGYKFDFEKQKYEAFDSDGIQFPLGSGNIYGTVDDLSKWVDSLRSNKFLTKKLLGKKIPIFGDVRKDDICAFGSDDGFRVLVSNYTDRDIPLFGKQDVTIILLINTSSTEFEPLKYEIEKIIKGRYVKRPQRKMVVPLKKIGSKLLDKYVGKYVDDDQEKTFTIVRRGDRLYYKYACEGQVIEERIFAKSPNDFFLQEDPSTEISIYDVDGKFRLMKSFATKI